MSRDVPYVSGRRRRIPRRVVVLSLIALLGLGGIATVLVLKSGGASSRFDGFVYVESNRARPNGNSVLAYRFRNNRLSFLAAYPTR